MDVAFAIAAVAWLICGVRALNATREFFRLMFPHLCLRTPAFDAVMVVVGGPFALKSTAQDLRWMRSYRRFA